ncbi:hypothetical protein ACFCYM_02145 [Streptomyces sp. NPDC056254]|uniref:hypothetical protein n=1 Tax=unclassified Streptomyces TaxID=2593676 RepID=UPI000A4A1A33|nr:MULTISPECIES: hypothetical protein [unclassified Streptomyces]
MRSKLVGLIGIFAVALVTGAAVTAQTADAGQPSGYEVRADDKGPGAPSPRPVP